MWIFLLFILACNAVAAPEAWVDNARGATGIRTPLNVTDSRGGVVQNATPTLTFSPTVTRTMTVTPTLTATDTMTGTGYTPEATASGTRTLTPVPTVTPTMTNTPTLTFTNTPAGPSNLEMQRAIATEIVRYILNSTTTPLASGYGVREIDPVANLKMMKTAFPESNVVQMATPTLSPTWVPSMTPTPWPIAMSFYYNPWSFAVPSPSSAWSYVTIGNGLWNKLSAYARFSGLGASQTIQISIANPAFNNNDTSTMTLLNATVDGQWTSNVSTTANERPVSVIGVRIIGTFTPAPTVSVGGHAWN